MWRNFTNPKNLPFETIDQLDLINEIMPIKPLPYGRTKEPHMSLWVSKARIKGIITLSEYEKIMRHLGYAGV